jgi:anti-repressor protein
MSNIQIFESPEFGKIRTVEVNGEPWMVGKDIAEALGYSNPRDALSKHVDTEDKGVANCDTPSGVQPMTIINESGLYSLVLSSKLPGAKAFRRWVTAEVLPSIRKNGGYIKGQDSMTDSELIAQALLVSQRILADNKKTIERMAPKEIFADSVAASQNAILIGELAKLLKQNGVDTGEKRLFDWMRDNGYLIRRKGTDWNMPTQRAMDMDLFRIKETVICHSDGHMTVNKTVKVTGKGQQYFVNQFLAK